METRDASKGAPDIVVDAPSDDELQTRLTSLPRGGTDDCRCEFAKTYYKAQVDAFTSRLAADAETRKADQAAGLDGMKALHAAMLETAKGAIERSRQAAEAARTAAAAVGTIYAAVLALAFSVDKPLPPRGVIPAIFLGLAIVLATAFVGWLPKTIEDSEATWPIPTGDVTEDQRTHTEMFILWVKGASLRRRRFLHGSILALGFGIAFLPMPFLSLGADNAPTAADAGPTPFPVPPPAASGGDAELQKILYQAQVTETVEIRKEQLQAAPAESPKTVGFWLIYLAAAAALLYTLAVTFAPDDRDEDKWPRARLPGFRPATTGGSAEPESR